MHVIVTRFQQRLRGGADGGVMLTGNVWVGHENLRWFANLGKQEMPYMEFRFKWNSIFYFPSRAIAVSFFFLSLPSGI